MKYRTRGRRLLLVVLQVRTRESIGVRLGIDASAISRWASGERRPSMVFRRALEALYRIPAAAWDVDDPRGPSSRG